MTYTLSKLGLTLVFFAAFFCSIVLAHAATGEIPNPLNSAFSNIPNFIAGALKVLVMIALPIVTLFFVYAGYLFVRAQGKPEKINEAKKNFVYVVLGAILILGAWVIATLIGGTVTQLVGNGL